MFTIVRIVNHKSFHILCAKLIYIFLLKPTIIILLYGIYYKHTINYKKLCINYIIYNFFLLNRISYFERMTSTLKIQVLFSFLK